MRLYLLLLLIFSVHFCDGMDFDCTGTLDELKNLYESALDAGDNIATKERFYCYVIRLKQDLICSRDQRTINQIADKIILAEVKKINLIFACNSTLKFSSSTQYQDSFQFNEYVLGRRIITSLGAAMQSYILPTPVGIKNHLGIQEADNLIDNDPLQWQQRRWNALVAMKNVLQEMDN